MVYSSINASALGFDVVRRPAAARLAGVLLTALAAPPVLLWELASRHPAARLARHEQEEALAVTALTRVAQAAVEPTGSQDLGDAPSASAWAGMLVRLSRVDLGGPARLERFIAGELLGADAPAEVPTHVRRLSADLLADAALAAWTSASRDPAAAALETLDDARESCRLPAGVDLGPHTDEVLALLADLPERLRQDRRTRAGDRSSPDPLRWAEAMHEACWAAHLSGRLRPAAAAQLLAASQVASTDLGVADLMGWAWNSTSALVAAAVVDDVLSAEASTFLRTHDSTSAP